MAEYIIFISSSDAYSDLWPIFFDLFEKYWPECQAKIYLNTEQADFTHGLLPITSTKVGKKKHFEAANLAGLCQVPYENILHMHINHFIMSKVDHTLVEEYFAYFKTRNLDALFLRKPSEKFTTPLFHKDLHHLSRIHSKSHRQQVVFWKKEKLIAKLRKNTIRQLLSNNFKHENKKEQYACSQYMPIPYLKDGALKNEMWETNIIPFLNRKFEAFDYSKRGINNLQNV